MGADSTSTLVDALLDEGFRGLPQDFADALADQDMTVSPEIVESALTVFESTGAARRSPKGMWYRAGRLVKKAEAHKGRHGHPIGSLQRRIVYAPTVCPDSLVLLTVREGTGGFRLRSYSLASSRPRVLSVPDANNNIGELVALLGPFTPDIWWDDPDVRGIDDVHYWYPIIRDLNKKHLQSPM